MILLAVASAVLVLNLPFGYWRANVRKFSLPWFLSVHAPVPVAIALRLASGIGFQLATIPLMVVAFFAGQMIGGRIFSWRAAHSNTPPTSCLVWDLLTNTGIGKQDKRF